MKRVSKQINIYIIFNILLVFMTTGSLLAIQETEQKSKEDLQRMLEKEFMAPCCWAEPVSTHRSDAASEVRAEISGLLEEGKTPDDIRAFMVAKYTERVLAKPTKEGFNLLAWFGPFIIIAMGFVVVGFYIKRNRGTGEISENEMIDDDL
ncbi:cytochrome c-type biogenesis protein CcmH [candidate division KSB1 bacterium]